jgi:EAL domain-containing protein (putative c-di-GMP-specific phosphodiesterase class I)
MAAVLRLDCSSGLHAGTPAATAHRMVHRPVVELEQNLLVGVEAVHAEDWAPAPCGCTECGTRPSHAPPGGLEVLPNRSSAPRVFVDVAGAASRGTGPRPADVVQAVSAEGQQVVALLTAAQTASPAGRLLTVVEEWRRLGCEIALDVSASGTAALLTLVEPDVVRLRPDLLWSETDTAVSRLRAVRAQVERSGAVLLADGIDYESDRRRAAAIGATWGQGGLLTAHLGRLGSARPGQALTPPAGRSRPARPTSSAARRGPVHVDATWLQGHLRWLADAAASGARDNVLVLDVPQPDVLPAGLVDRFTALQRSSGLTVLTLGRPDVRSDTEDAGSGVRSSAEDVIGVLIGPSVAHCVTARPVLGRRFEVTVTDSWEEVARAARRLVADLT